MSIRVYQLTWVKVNTKKHIYVISHPCIPLSCSLISGLIVGVLLDRSLPRGSVKSQSICANLSHLNVNNVFLNQSVHCISFTVHVYV